MIKVFTAVRKSYETIYPWLFFAYIFCLMSFGRAFLVLSVFKLWVPLFVTEFFLLISLPYIFINRKLLSELPSVIKWVVGLFWLQAIIHFIVPISEGNLFALRDIVFWGYPLFFLLGFMMFREQKYWYKFFILILVGMTFVIIESRFFMLTQPIFQDSRMIIPYFNSFFTIIRGFHLTFFLGLGISFITGFYFFEKNRIFRFFMLFLLLFGYYLVVIMLCRSAWVGMLGCLLVSGAVLLKFSVRLNKSWLILCGLLILLVCIFDFNIGDPGTAALKGKISSLSELSLRTLNLVEKPENKGFVQIKENNKKRNEVKYSEKINDNTNIENVVFDKTKSVSVATANWRYLIWSQGIEFGLQSPIWGKGFGVYPQYHYSDGSLMTEIKGFGLNSRIIPSHNFLITVFFKMGIIGLFLVLMFFGFIFNKAWDFIKQQKVIGDIRFAMVLSLSLCLLWWVLIGLFSDMIESPINAAFLWLLSGMFFSIPMKNRSGDGI
ncbi:MAG: O-antigen ligase family protein [Candidatus Omnitrophica bacterium]|nr:O-antigen ligase family protein [Candidatus Omnitrophota bacterium]